MLELTTSNAAEYLSSQWGYDRSSLSIEPLGGGVSNTVLLVETRESRFILKQSLGKLQVEQDWFADRERIFRESDGIRALAPHLPAGSVPVILFEDRENCLYAMTSAPRDAHTWKSLLMGGQIDLQMAETVARMQGVMISVGMSDTGLARKFSDQTVFDQLRLDPYYRYTASRYPDLAGAFERLIEYCSRERLSLVHGDWSPKNFLVGGERVMAIDFEVIHFGDPAFDTAFLLNHMALKAFYLPERADDFRAAAEHYWRTLTRELPVNLSEFEARTVRHLGGLLLARVDGKSPAEYIRQEQLRQRIRAAARGLMLNPPASLMDAIMRVTSWD